MERAINAIRRCAIYTRKSSEEGLEQDFNSLHAQREACEAFIKSQQGEGWRLVKAPYDDGGLSGGKAKGKGAPNLHVVAAESAAEDFGTAENSLDPDVILLSGFSGRLDSEALRNPKIWVPVLGEAQDIRLQRIFDKIQPDQICPVVPFPTRDPRRGDRIVESHQRILFDEFSVEPRNILYASEYNPFEAYREVFMAIDRYRDALVELGDCRVFVSPLSSKLLSVSALLACYDHKCQKSERFYVGIPYVEVASYGPSKRNLQAERMLTSMWLTGEWEAP